MMKIVASESPKLKWQVTTTPRGNKGKKKRRTDCFREVPQLITSAEEKVRGGVGAAVCMEKEVSQCLMCKKKLVNNLFCLMTN